MGYEDAAVSERAAAAARELDMFDPPLPGSLLVGQPLLMVPDSDIKYKSFWIGGLQLAARLQDWLWMAGVF